MENKNNSKSLIAIIVVLVIIVIGMGIYIAFDKGIIFSSFNNENNISDNKDIEDDVIVPTDMKTVSEKLNNTFEWFVTRSIALDAQNSGKNLIANKDGRLMLLDGYFMNSGNCNWASDPQAGKQDMPYVTIDAYKAKYQEFYGSLDNFASDISEPSPLYYKANTYYSNLSDNLVAWNGTWGTVGISYSFEATNVTFDKVANNYVITGNLIEHNKAVNHGTFKIVYVDNNTNKYITDIIVYLK